MIIDQLPLREVGISYATMPAGKRRRILTAL
jgi:hypothetical protein